MFDFSVITIPFTEIEDFVTPLGNTVTFKNSNVRKANRQWVYINLQYYAYRLKRWL